jgi:hypothetical protein
MTSAKHHTIEKAQSITIPPEASYGRCSGAAEFKIATDMGPIAVEFGRYGGICFRGTPEAIIGFGLMLPEWMPGLPGNNATTLTVAFDEAEPRIYRGGKRTPRESRIRVRAWGAATRTVEVLAPPSPDQVAQHDRFYEQHADRTWEQYREEDSIGQQHVARAPVAPKSRTVGNVVYPTHFIVKIALSAIRRPAAAASSAVARKTSGNVVFPNFGAA